MFRSFTYLAAAAAFAMLATGAEADKGFTVVAGTVDVAYGDLDLGTASGAGAMLARIEKAAKQACGIMPERDRFYRSNPEFVSRAFRACTRQAVRDAVARLSAPLVSRAFAETRGADTDVASH